MNIYALVKAILSTIALVFISDGYISAASIFPFLIAALLYFFYLAAENEHSIWTKIAGLVFAFLASLSLFQVNVFDSLLGELSLFVMLVKLLVFAAGIYYLSVAILVRIYRWLDNYHLDTKLTIGKTKIFIISFITLLVLYLPVWLMEYPSNISPDTLSQIWQILNGQYVNHHPFAHTLWLKLLMSFADELNLRIAIAAAIQMVINAAVFSYVIAFVTDKTKSLSLTIFSWAFYGLLSFNAFFSITLIKDVTHATITCLMVVLLYKSYSDKRLIDYGLFGLITVGFCLFRSNGYYACFLVLAVSLAIGWWQHSYRVSLIILGALILSALIKGPLYHALGVSDPSIVEMLSIPLQQIAFVIRNGGKIGPEEYAMLNQVVDVSRIPEAYDFFLSDPVKNLVNEFANLSYLKANALNYFKLWLKIGIDNPILYIRAWVNQISLLFSPHYYATSIFWTVHPNDLGIVGQPLLIEGTINEQLHMLAYQQHNIPLIGWFHYQSFTTWIMLGCAFYSLRRKDPSAIVIFSIFIGILITLCLSSPYNLCFRYYYAVVACLPLMLFLTFRKI